jgi:hypothetical protein
VFVILKWHQHLCGATASSQVLGATSLQVFGADTNSYFFCHKFACIFVAEHLAHVLKTQCLSTFTIYSHCGDYFWECTHRGCDGIVSLKKTKTNYTPALWRFSLLRPHRKMGEPVLYYALYNVLYNVLHYTLYNTCSFLRLHRKMGEPTYPSIVIVAVQS